MHRRTHLERKTQAQTDAVMDAAADAVNTRLENPTQAPERFQRKHCSWLSRGTPPLPHSSHPAGWLGLGLLQAPCPLLMVCLQGQTAKPQLGVPYASGFVLVLSQSPGM